MKTMKALLYLASLSLLISCESDENPSAEISTFPISAGNEWLYERIEIRKQYESDSSNKVIAIDTIISKEKIWIEKDTVLNDTMKVWVFKTKDTTGLYTEYKFLDNEGLKTYATRFYTSDIMVKDQPALDIKYPLESNSSWLAEKFDSTYINKKVLGMENINVSGKEMATFKIETDISHLGPDSTATPNLLVHFNLWIADIGLVKRMSESDKVLYTDSEGHEVGYFQQTITTTLKSYTIK